MTRFATVLTIGATLHSVHVAAPQTHQSHIANQTAQHAAHERAPVLRRWRELRASNALEQRLFLGRQPANVETGRPEALGYRQSDDNQTPAGQSATTTYAGLAVGNALAGTDAQTCALPNGSTIQVSGGLRSSACQN